MPKEGLSLLVTLKDGASPGLITLADKTKALDKESQALQMTTERLAKANDGLMKKQSQLKSETFLAGKEVDRLTKAYSEYGDEMMKLDLDQAIENHAKLKNELMQVESQLKSNRKAYEENLAAIRKGGLSQEGELGLSQDGKLGLSDMAKGLMAGQIGQMFADSLGGLGQSVLTSAIGTPQASLVSDTLSGAISGGAAGAMFGLPGIAAGAALGGFSGLISGGTKIFEAKDDAFKDYYGGLYEDVSARPGQMITAGSSTAAGREKDQISFTTLFGDRQVADVDGIGQCKCARGGGPGAQAGGGGAAGPDRQRGKDAQRPGEDPRQRSAHAPGDRPGGAGVHQHRHR